MSMSEDDKLALSPRPGMCYDHNSTNGYESSRSDAGDNQEAPLDFSLSKPRIPDTLVSNSSSPSPNFTAHQPENYSISNGSVSDSERTCDSKSPHGSPIHNIGDARSVIPGVMHAQRHAPMADFVNAGAGMLQVAGALGALQGILPPLIDPSKSAQFGTTNLHSKPTRPFKAYPKDPLSLPLGYYGIPGLTPFTVENNSNVTAQQLTMTSEELFEQYRRQVLRTQGEIRKDRSRSRDTTTAVGITTSQITNTSHSPAQSNLVLSMPPTDISPTSSPTNTGSPPPPGSQGRKRGRILPDDQKDEAYWERRRKNNDAAKRSRDARRAKEDEIAIRAAFLEQENLKLRVEVAALKNETAKLRCMLYNS